MGNTVGRTATAFCDLNDTENAYAFGLWCADGYHRTSSIGLTNTDINLISGFRRFLLRHFSANRIKLRIYSRGFSQYYLEKAVKPAYQIYVNSRVLLRYFKEARRNPKQFLNQKEAIQAYFAGRFDGDGSVGEDGRCDLRIVYGSKKEAEQDVELLNKLEIAAKLYFYRTAKTFVIYIPRREAGRFLRVINPYTLRRREQ